ncbi:hypothetical protein M5K25_000390 [Dendrobium thyrsiflorum]|uniref:Endoplasmic reticulum metallopeptidase 1-like C-terminal domain-containing protein n=1 Tax=Dendrobium thyrsiflorum TaxID=117978 RepID=A0ABD0W6J3_DENTH
MAADKDPSVRFARPYLAFLMFIPSSLIGLLIPRAIWISLPVSQKATCEKLSNEVLSDETFFWGAFGLYAFITLVYHQAGLEGGYLTFVMSSTMLFSWFFFRLTRKHFGHQSLKSLAVYVIPSIPCLTYSVYFGGFFVQFLIEKMGMMGSLPLPYGYFVPDAIVAAIVGVVTGWCMGPILPLVSRWLAKPLILRCLLQLSVLGLAISAQFFPYSEAAPKRVVLQHTVRHADASKIVDSSFDFSVVDANSLAFLFKNSPEAAKMLHIGSDFSFNADHHSIKSSWVAIFPLPFLFSGSLKFPAPQNDVSKQYSYLPSLSIDESALLSTTRSRRVHLDLNLGSSKEVWVTVLNITGPLSNWSFADNKLPASESMDGGPPSYICRLSGRSHEKWTFWLEANTSEALRVDLALPAVTGQAAREGTEGLAQELEPENRGDGPASQGIGTGSRGTEQSAQGTGKSSHGTDTKGQPSQGTGTISQGTAQGDGPATEVVGVGGAKDKGTILGGKGVLSHMPTWKSSKPFDLNQRAVMDPRKVLEFTQIAGKGLKCLEIGWKRLSGQGLSTFEIELEIELSGSLDWFEI